MEHHAHGPSTKGIKKKIGAADRTPRETLEKRLEERQVTLVVSHKARP
jgi:hypothetical protein